MHQTFELTLQEKEKKTRGPRLKGFVKKWKSRSQACYKRKNGILKRPESCYSGDDSVVGFLKKLVDGGTEKYLVYSTMNELLLKFKFLSFYEEVAPTSSKIAYTSNAEMVGEQLPVKQIKV